MNKLKRGQASYISIASTGVAYEKPRPKAHTRQELEYYKDEYSTADHLLTLQQLEERYCTSVINGLTQLRANDLLDKYGANCLTAPPVRSRWWLLIDFYFCGFAILMWLGVILSTIGAVLSYLSDLETYTEHMYLACILFLVIIITGTFGFYHESINVGLMEDFEKLLPKNATVIRDGQHFRLPSEEIVLGDLVELKPGDWIPADLRLTEANFLKVDNSAITGEVTPEPRNTEIGDVNPLDATNLVFYSTIVTEGTGKGIVINVGDNTLIGHIAGLTTSISKQQTPLRREINRFIKIITIIAILIGVTFFAMCFKNDYNFFLCFSYLIALSIANIPEGLPVTLTACMTLTSRRMHSKNCLIKNNESIETLGCCNVICTDKTGTLTQNRMKVIHLYFDNYNYYILNNESVVDLNNLSFKTLTLIASLCSNAYFEPGQEHLPIDSRRIIGDASESAILKCMESLNQNVRQLRMQYPKVCEIPFNSYDKYQFSIHRTPVDDHLLVIKGAPERLLKLCNRILYIGQTGPLTEKLQKDLIKQIYKYANDGERVLAFADLKITDHDLHKFNLELCNIPLRNLRFVGFITMMDPPRPSVPEAVVKCKSAGIRIIMITGDHPITATSIAKQVGIISMASKTKYDIATAKNKQVTELTDDDLKMCDTLVITGNELREMSNAQLEMKLNDYDEILFARTSPQQKLKVVEVLQHMQQIVAVTGDGVNDSPALKQANIGVSMGIQGSDVSKDAADIILLDDNFSTIITAIEEGRLIFDNLKKSIAYLLTSNLPEILPFVIMLTLDFPPILNVITVIIIDIGTDLWPAISLIYEQPEADIMHRQPRDSKVDTLINRRLIDFTYAEIGMIQTFAGFVCYFCIMAIHGFYYDQLIGLYQDWISPHKIITDSFGRKWTYHQRLMLTRKCYSGYFFTMSLTQITDLLICKTRRLSLFQQGMSNWILNFSIVFEISLTILLIYCPYINDTFQFQPIAVIFLLPSIPFALFILIIDEIRKAIIRKKPDGLIATETYY